jgi:hypothetical protein
MARIGHPPGERPPAPLARIVLRPKPKPTNLPKRLVGDWRDPLDLLRLTPVIGARPAAIAAGVAAL